MPATIQQPPADTTNVFNRLDQDWAITCRRHRRTDTLARWAADEPALADVTGLDQLAARGQAVPAGHFVAVLAITRTGDSLAARTLMQMIRPGLVKITRELYTRRHPNLASEVITAAWACIHRIQAGTVNIHTASCLLRSIRRDVLRARLSTHPTASLDALDPADPSHDDTNDTPDIGESLAQVVEPAETLALAGRLAKAAMDDAVRRGVITQTTADLVWQSAVDQEPVSALAAAAGTPISTAYALRAAGHAQLREHLAAA